MYWLRVLWAIVRGIAAGVSATKWDDFMAEKYGVKKKKQAPQSDPPPPGPFTGPVAPSEPAEGVRVDVERKEGEFTGGLPYMGDTRVRPAQAQAAPRDGESRRKRRTRPAAPTPEELVCARCKAALDNELVTPDAESLAVAQEAAQEEAAPETAAGQAAINVPKDDAAGSEGDTAECLETDGNNGDCVSPVVPDAVRPALADRLVTRLGTRGSLTRLSEARASLENNTMGG
jgi:hypothetical protein